MRRSGGYRHLGTALGGALAWLALISGGAQAADPGPYVALGDSFTAAPLVPVQYGIPIGCLRSDHNYPSLVSAAIGATGFRDESCSGATTGDMTAPQTVPLGVHAPQFDALSADTALVTIGIGGNDARLVEAAVTCLQLGLLAPAGTACRSHFNRAGRDELMAGIAATAPKIAAVLQDIHARAPQARVVIVGYPAMTPRDGRSCYPLVPLSQDDLRYFDELLVAINTMIAEQAAANDAEYADTFADSIGHDVCAAPGTRWFEGLVPTAIAFPIHPNGLGEASMARSLLRVLGEPRPGPALSAVSPARRVHRAGRAVSVTYRLGRPATVTFALRRQTAGRLVAGRCVVPSGATRGRPACRRYSRVLQTNSVTGAAGDNSLRISARRLTRAGLYRLTATASGAPGERAGAPQTTHFRVRPAAR